MTQHQEAPAPPTALPGEQRRRRVRAPGFLHAPRALWLLAAVAFLAYATLSIRRFVQVESGSWDLGIFVQVVRSYAALEAPVSDIKGVGFNILGDHFSPILVLLAPLYKLFPSAITLLTVQAALFALSVVPITRAAIRATDRTKGMMLGCAYALSWGVQSAVYFDFHEICFAVPLLAFAGEQLLLRRWWAAARWLLPLLLVKEDLGLTVAVAGLYVLAEGGRRAGAVLLASGLAGCAVIVLVLIPAMNNGGKYEYWRKMDEGSSLGPGNLAGLFLDGTEAKLTTLLLLFGITAFVAFRSRLVLLVVPTLGWRFLSGEPHYWSTDWHYDAVLMPLLFVALLDGVVRLRQSPRPWLRGYAAGTVPAVLAVALTLCGRFPIAQLASPDTYRASDRAASAAQVVARVPAGATVETSGGILSHLVDHARVLWVGNAEPLLPEYVVVDLGGWNPASDGDYVGYAERAHPGASYTTVFRDRHYVVLREQDARRH
ncbi:DUF2079 domain-containing protein [Streptomyces sp. NPDC049906]|uniref:DUF2079 domain-containing protein n=1 Tax=Streptomyces sp. NPDC049906 TaxID=3155656 RepID=UPI00341607BA